MIEANVKKEQQQSLHSLRPLGEGGRRPDEGLKRRTKETQSQRPPLEGGPKSLISRRGADKSALTYGEKMQCNSYEILKQLGCSRVTAFRTFFSQALLAPKKAPTASARNPQVQDDGIRIRQCGNFLIA